MSAMPSPESLERVFHAALADGDARGVDAALRLLAVADPRRAQRLYDALKDALKIRAALDGQEAAR